MTPWDEDEVRPAGLGPPKTRSTDIDPFLYSGAQLARPRMDLPTTSPIPGVAVQPGQATPSGLVGLSMRAHDLLGLPQPAEYEKFQKLPPAPPIITPPDNDTGITDWEPVRRDVDVSQSAINFAPQVVGAVAEGVGDVARGAGQSAGALSRLAEWAYPQYQQVEKALAAKGAGKEVDGVTPPPPKFTPQSDGTFTSADISAAAGQQPDISKAYARSGEWLDQAGDVMKVWARDNTPDRQVPSVDMVKDWRTALVYGMESVAQATGSTVPTLAAYAVSGPFAAAIPTYAMSVGQMRDSMERAGLDSREQDAIILAGGAIMGRIEMMSHGALSDLFKEQLGKHVVRRMLTAGGRGGATEGLEEILQEATQIAGEAIAKGENVGLALLSDEGLARIKEAGAQAFVGGFGIGAGGTGLRYAGQATAEQIKSWADARERATLGDTTVAPEDVGLTSIFPERHGDGKSEPLAAITVYHGSPHDFDRFDSSRIGTGEGAQAFGHGLYFAENKNIAMWYHESLTQQTLDVTINGKRAHIDSDTKNDILNSLSITHKKGVVPGDFIDLWNETLSERIIDASYQPYVIELKKARQWLNDLEGKDVSFVDAAVGHGAVYEVSLDAEPHHLLDWDAPWSAQPDAVKSAVASLGMSEEIAAPTMEGTEPTGATVYMRMAREIQNRELAKIDKPGISPAEKRLDYGRNTEADVSRMLASAGVPGIRYFDGASRSNGDGTRNYVVFDPKILEITHKNGESVKKELRDQIVSEVAPLAQLMPDDAKDRAAKFKAWKEKKEAEKLIEPKTTAEIISSRLTAGMPVPIPERLSGAIIDMIAPMRSIIPDGARVGVVANIRPDQSSAETAIVDVRTLDGTPFAVIVNRDQMLNSKALFLPRSRAIVLLPFDEFDRLAEGTHGGLVEDIPAIIRGSFVHEMTHLLSRSGVMSAGDFRRLVDHSNLLGVLDLPVREYFRLNGTPDYNSISPTQTIRESYERLYANFSDVHEAIDQEAAAIFMEMVNRGAVDKSSTAPVQDIIGRYFSGAGPSAAVGDQGINTPSLATVTERPTAQGDGAGTSADVPAGYTLKLPFKDKWGDTRTNARDAHRATEALRKIYADVSFRTATWKTMLNARNTVREIVANSFYYPADMTTDDILSLIDSDIATFVLKVMDEQSGRKEGNPRGTIFDRYNDDSIGPMLRMAARILTGMVNARRHGLLDLIFDGVTPSGRKSPIRPNEIGKTMRSGFYSMAGRLLSDVPDGIFRQGGHAVINWLEQAGVKRSEIEHFQLREKFGETKPAVREDFADAIARRLFDFKRKLLKWNPERPTGDYEYGRTRAFDGPRIPGRGEYFERMIAFPKKLRGGEMFFPGLFESPHWEDQHKGTWASWRGTVRDVPGWGKMVVGEEGQSDYMQGASSGRRARISTRELKERLADSKAFNRVNDLANSLLDQSGLYRMSDLGSVERDYRDRLMPNPLMTSRDEWDMTLRQARQYVLQKGLTQGGTSPGKALAALDKLAELRDANEQFFSEYTKYAYGDDVADDVTPETPIDRSYVRTMVRDLLLHAAKSGADSVAISTSETTARIQNNPDAAHFYDAQLRPAMQKELRRQTGDSSLTLEKITLPKAMGSPRNEKPYSVWAVKIPEQLRDKIKAEGQPLFAITGRSKAPSLVAVIREMGGIRDVTGDISKMMGARPGQSGYIPGIINKNGVHPDKAREALVSGGWLLETVGDGEAKTTVNDLYDLLDRMFRGERVHPQTPSDIMEHLDLMDEERSAVEQEQYDDAITQVIERVDAYIDNHGLAPLTERERRKLSTMASPSWTDDDIDAALEELYIETVEIADATSKAGLTSAEDLRVLELQKQGMDIANAIDQAKQETFSRMEESEARAAGLERSEDAPGGKPGAADSRGASASPQVNDQAAPQQGQLAFPLPPAVPPGTGGAPTLPVTTAGAGGFGGTPPLPPRGGFAPPPGGRPPGGPPAGGLPPPTYPQATPGRPPGLIGRAWNAFLGWYNPVNRIPQANKYRIGKYKTLGKIARANDIARSIWEDLRGASNRDQRAAYDYLTTRGATASTIGDAKVRQAAIDAKRIIDMLGQALVSRGLIPQQSYDKYRDQYLPRIYLKHMIERHGGTIAGFANAARPSDMGYTKQRKDIDKEARLLMGEITDPGFLAARGILRTYRDIALIDFLDSISQNHSWVFERGLVPFKGRNVSPFWLKAESEELSYRAIFEPDTANRQRMISEANAMRALAVPYIRNNENVPDGYSQIPDTQRYGMLRGMWVRKEIKNDLLPGMEILPDDASSLQRFFSPNGYGGRASSLWKAMKVPMNPATQIRNFISNMIMLNLSGMGPVDIPRYIGRAAAEMYTDGPYYKAAKSRGLTASGFSEQELVKISREFLDIDRKIARQSPFFPILYPFVLAKELGTRMIGFSGDLYQKAESLTKLAKMIHDVEQSGRSIDDAYLEAQKWLFDYSEVPSAIRYLRNVPFGAPFITYFYKALPVLLETAATKPWRLAPYVALPHIAAAVFAFLHDVDKDDVEKLKQSLPEFLRSKENAMLLPMRDAAGRWQFFDFGYLLPWSMFQEAGTQAAKGEASEAIRTAGLLGGPIADMIVALKTGIDPFTKRPIYDKRDPPQDQMRDIMSYLARATLPPWMTDQSFALKMWDAYKQNPTKYGDSPLTMGQAAARGVGMNVYPVEPEVSRSRNINRMSMEIHDLETRKRQQLKDQRLSDDERQKVSDKYNALIDKAKQRKADYQTQSTINPKLLTSPPVRDVGKINDWQPVSPQKAPNDWVPTRP